MPTLSQPDLFACVEALPPLDLLGLSLMRRPLTEADTHRGQWFPTTIPPEQLIAATLELIAYTDRCRAVAHKLADVRPVPCTLPLLEYPL